jgi:hypothetical protein
MSVQEYINHQWETGDKVVSEYYGLGEVIEILPIVFEPNIRVQFSNKVVKDFYRNGDVIQTFLSDRVGITEYNERKGIQHCTIVLGDIHTNNIDECESDDLCSDGEVEIWYSLNHALNMKHNPELNLD